MITSDDKKGIKDLKKFLAKKFEIKDLFLKYFLGMEVARSSKGICVFQHNTY